MADSSIKNDLMAQIDKLSPQLQLRLLDLAKNLAPHGIEGRRLLRFKGAIDAGDLQLMSKAIVEGCKKVDISEW